MMQSKGTLLSKGPTGEPRHQGKLSNRNPDAKTLKPKAPNS